MPLTIFHGDHHIKSRQAYRNLVSQLQSNQVNFQLLEAKQLHITELENLLGTSSLFAEKTGIQIEELHSLPKSQRKTQLIELLQSSISDDIAVVLWEKKKLTATELKKFPQAKTQFFPLSSRMFTWLNSLEKAPVAKQLSLFQQTVQYDGVEFCFAMFARQIRILLTKAADASPRSKKLLSIHEALTFADDQMKTGRNSLTLEQCLTQLVIKLNSS